MDANATQPTFALLGGKTQPISRWCHFHGMTTYVKAKGRLDGGASRVWGCFNGMGGLEEFRFYKGHDRGPKDDPDFVIPIPDYKIAACQEFWCGDSKYTMDYSGETVRIDSFKYPERWASVKVNTI